MISGLPTILAPLLEPVASKPLRIVGSGMAFDGINEKMLVQTMKDKGHFKTTSHQ